MATETEVKEKNNYIENPRNQIYIILFGFVAVIIFFTLFFIFPYLQEIKKNSEELVSEKNNLVFLTEQFSQVEKFKDNYETYKPNLEKIDQLYVDSNNPVVFFEFLEKTALDCQVKSTISLSTGSLSAQDNSIYFQIYSQGKFVKIIKFLEKLESGPYLVEIQNLSIASDEKLVNANFLIKAYKK